MTKNNNKPQIRFKGFTNAWEQRKLGQVSVRVQGNDGEMGLPTLTISASEGWMKQEDRFSRNIAGKEQKNYTLLHKGELSYNHGNSKLAKYGTVFSLESYEKALVPRVYHSFKLKEGNPKFIEYYFATKIPDRELGKLVSSGARMDGLLNISFDAFMGINVVLPSVSEQDKIATFLENLDNLITLHQRKLEKLQKIKKFCLEKFFPKNGSNFPEIRFKGFNNAWEQCEFGNLVLIERGGSPRPIENFITDNPNGLNWIKIGDAPKYGNYISKTSEKIKSSGLSKTRKVSPGDLILSNSMSFGKPYIMAIEGCIHDGWLLIRNNKSFFDLIFLCHMLGTEKMFTQYKSLAAGSTVNNLNKDLVSKASVSTPNILEQKKIGGIFECLDNLITLHQRKLEKLQKIKKFCLEKMFV